MKQIIYISLISLFLGLGNTSDAQKGRMLSEDNLTKFKTERIAFITSNLDLTPEEAEKFWPIFNKMTNERMTIVKKRQKIMRQAKDNKQELSNDEITTLTKNLCATKIEEANLCSEYNLEFIKILPAKKVLKLYQTQMKFRMHMLKKYRDRNKANKAKKDRN